jgi:cyclopropane-fatty-acyl-phospholipid synthase
MAQKGFDILDVESLRPHYAATLARWVRRLEAGQARAVALAGEERYRIWRIYMAGCATAFDRNWLSVYQIIGGKSDSAGSLARPWTRQHQYQSDDSWPVAEHVDWDLPRS